MLGERLKKLRNERKITQEELGKIVNVTKVSISGYENGNRNPDTETLQKLADFFNVSTDFLLGRTDEPDVGKGVEDDEFQDFMKDPLNNIMFDNWLKMSVEQRKEALRMIKYLRHREKLDEDL